MFDYYVGWGLVKKICFKLIDTKSLLIYFLVDSLKIQHITVTRIFAPR